MRTKSPERDDAHGTNRTVSTEVESALLGLAPGGVYPASAVTSTAVRSYRTVSPLPVRPASRDAIGGLFSVALSLFSRTVGVTHHRVLWSPDFPLPAKAVQRSPGPLRERGGGREELGVGI